MDDAGRVKRIVLLVATVASFLTPFMGSAMNVAIPWIGADLRMSPLERHWVVTAYLLSTAACLLPFGRAAEPWEVANAIVFLASDLSSYMTGEVLAVSSQHP